MAASGWYLNVGVSHQISQRDLKRPCYLCRQHKPNVLTSTLDTAHVGAVDFGVVREGFL